MRWNTFSRPSTVNACPASERGEFAHRRRIEVQRRGVEARDERGHLRGRGQASAVEHVGIVGLNE
jgi:hypothetical protein